MRYKRDIRSEFNRTPPYSIDGGVYQALSDTKGEMYAVSEEEAKNALKLIYQTEEIDIVLLNNSDDPRYRRESALLLVECKNWSSKIGKNEFVIFKEKIENRRSRCTLGFLISWNGFTDTFTKEMLRGSREQVLVIPIDGKDIILAIQKQAFAQALLYAFDDAVNV